MTPVEVVNGTDWPLVAVTAAGAIAVIYAAFVAGRYSARQDHAQYREGLNKQRHEVYPTLVQWTATVEVAITAMAAGQEPGDIPRLWCCASPDLLQAIKKLSDGWGGGGSFTAAPAGQGAQETADQYKDRLRSLVTGIRRQARWDLFGKDAFGYDGWQKVKPEQPGPHEVPYTG